MQSNKSNNFIPWKLYSHGSLLTSINKIDTIVKHLKDSGVKAGALVDLENVFLAVQFYKAMKKNGMRPIIGCGFTVKNAKAITMIAKNKAGWETLLSLIHKSYLNDPNAPYLNLKDIDPSGLVCLVGSPYSWYSVEEHDYIDLYISLAELFKNDIYVEVHPDYQFIADILESLYNAKRLACADAFYFEDDEKILNEILIATKLKKKFNDKEIREHFLVVNNFKYRDVSDLIKDDSSEELLAKLEDIDLLGPPLLPEFKSGNPDEELRKICEDNLQKLNLSDDHHKRLHHELDVIKEADLSSYFLIVQDIIKFAKSKGMMVGGCRGCLGSDTNVFLHNGRVKKINKINIGDKVICDDGSSQRVKNVFMYKNYDPMYKIVTYYGDTNGLTVTPEHKILTKEGWKEASKLTKSDMIFYPKIKGRNESVEYELDVYKQAYLLGLFAGDGWIRSDRESAAYIIFGLKDILSLTKTCNFLSSLNYKYSIQYVKDDNVYIVSILSNDAYLFFRNQFKDYEYSSRTKHVPSSIIENTKLVSEFLTGYDDSDGTPETNGKKYTTVSKRLAYEARFLHHMINVPATISTYKRDQKNEYYVRSKKDARFVEIVENGYYARVRKIDILEPEMYVYDIEVENKHNYLTTNGIVHNSVGGAMTAYLSGITDIDPLEYGLIFERFYNSSRNFEPHISFKESDYVEFKNQNI